VYQVVSRTQAVIIRPVDSLLNCWGLTSLIHALFNDQPVAADWRVTAPCTEVCADPLEGDAEAYPYYPNCEERRYYILVVTAADSSA
jgi:hypothetical protein